MKMLRGIGVLCEMEVYMKMLMKVGILCEK